MSCEDVDDRDEQERREPGCQGEFYSEPPSDHVARYGWALEKLKPFGDGLWVLDVGCGSGYGVQMFQAAGLRAFGLDRNPKALEFCKRRGVPAFLMDYPTPMFSPASKWGAITMFEVVEHSPTGMDVLYAACADASVVLASVPYKEPPGGNHHHHLFNLTEKDFEWMTPAPEFTRLPDYPYCLLIHWQRSWP